MIYGPAPQRSLPQQNPEVTLLQFERFLRAQEGMRDWAEKAKKAVEYYENKQWRAADLAKLKAEGRPPLTINKIRPLVNLVLGYHLNNRTDISYKPGNDMIGTDEIAGALSHVSKHISQVSDLPSIDGEVFLDGCLTGRGFYDSDFSFEHNDFGEHIWRACDPFAKYLDPEADQYDLNSGTFIMDRRWLSIDEIGFYFGKRAQELLQPMVSGGSFSGMPNGFFEREDEVTPWRRFGGEGEGEAALFGNQLLDYVDTARKNVQTLCIEHYVPVWQWHFIDAETGDREPIPEHFSREDIIAILKFAHDQGDPIMVQKRQRRRVRWTYLAADLIVFDDWSPFETFRTIPYFPYFRRGQTQGMVEFLTDSQDEINKRRSSRLNIINRAAAGGWIYPKGSLDAQQKANLELFGSSPGFQLEYDTKNGQLQNAKPEQITPGTNPIAHAQLEAEAEGDLNDIAGINKDAMGKNDKVQSGLAIQSKQRQSIIGLEGFLSNFSRTKRLQGMKQLEVIQSHYTEPRIIRIIGEGNEPITQEINQRTAHGIKNNVTLGKYVAIVDETPLSKTFLEAQFEEIMRMKEAGMPIPDDMVIDASSFTKKQELKAKLAEARRAQQAAEQAAAGLVPPGGVEQVPVPLASPNAGGKTAAGDNAPKVEPGRPPGGNVVPMQR